MKFVRYGIHQVCPGVVNSLGTPPSGMSRTRDFTVVGRYNYRYAVNAFIKLDERIHGVMVVIPTNHREIPGSSPGRYNLQIEIISPSCATRDSSTLKSFDNAGYCRIRHVVVERQLF